MPGTTTTSQSEKKEMPDGIFNPRISAGATQYRAKRLVLLFRYSPRGHLTAGRDPKSRRPSMAPRSPKLRQAQTWQQISGNVYRQMPLIPYHRWSTTPPPRDGGQWKQRRAIGQ